MTRRQFTKLLLACCAGGALPGCTGSDDYTEADARRLEERMRREAEASGKGPYGRLRFRGYRGLAELPYFDLDGNGDLRLAVDDLPRSIDCHTHLGMNFLFAPDVDLQRRTERIRYLLDCDRDRPGCDLDLDAYINSAFTEEMHDELGREFRNQLLFGGEAAATHTIPNLLAEMDRVGCGQVVVLAIAAGLPFGDDLSERWLDQVARAKAKERLLVFASVHPSHGDWRWRLRRFARRGVRGIKVHPELQRVFPDEPRMMEIYEECDDLGLVVFFHAGRSGIEPGLVRPYALMRRYAAAVESFPRVRFVFGHAGARDVDDAVRIAAGNDNVWLEITGQGVTSLERILREVGSERLLFGSDWPFYPLAATLAKVLVVTEERPEARVAILRGNAVRLLGLGG